MSTSTATQPEEQKQRTPTGHDVHYEWQHLCFFLAECICGKTMWATSRPELNRKWKEHTDGE